jgi:hypothetical protein
MLWALTILKFVPILEVLTTLQFVLTLLDLTILKFVPIPLVLTIQAHALLIALPLLHQLAPKRFDLLSQ